MPVSSVERPVSPLRRRMLEDFAMRGLCTETQRDYVRFAQAPLRPQAAAGHSDTFGAPG
jgi:hypothetical protein